MSAPSDPRHDIPGAPSTQELPVVPPAPAEPPAGATRAGALPAPGQLPPQPQVAAAVPPPVPPPAPATARPDTVLDAPAPPTRPVTVADDPPAGGAGGNTSGVAATGPVDFVPGLPGAGSTEPERPRRRLRLPGGAPDRSALAGLGLAALAVVLLQLGLAQDDGRLWSAVTLWSAFATAATVLGLVALGARVAAPERVSAGAATRLAGAAVLALAIFWLLVVLPIVASDPGFLVTAALLALGGALWVGPARER